MHTAVTSHNCHMELSARLVFNLKVIGIYLFIKTNIIILVSISSVIFPTVCYRIKADALARVQAEREKEEKSMYKDRDESGQTELHRLASQPGN